MSNTYTIAVSLIKLGVNTHIVVTPISILNDTILGSHRSGTLPVTPPIVEL